MVQDSWISEHILRRKNHLCVPVSPTSSGEVFLPEPSLGVFPLPRRKWWLQGLRSTAHEASLTSFGFGLGQALDPECMNQHSLSLNLVLPVIPRQTEGVTDTEDNSRATDLKRASDQNQNQFYSGKQSLVYTELQTVSTFLKELLARWDYKAVELMFISQWEWVHLYGTDIFVTHSDTVHLIKK